MTVHVTVPVDEALKADLDAWANARGMTIGSVLAEAVEAYVADQREMLAAVEAGRADVAAGRVAPHDEVKALLKARRQAWATGS